jgi:hypothetical protein
MGPSSSLCAPCRRKKVGPEHGAWKGGLVRDKQGYIREYVPDHPRANMRRYVKQHHLVMERRLGRYLLPGESVHHRNGNRTDNRIENLELWAVAQPAGQRATDLLTWAHEVIARYEGVSL